MRNGRIPTRVVPSSRPAPLPPAAVAREFRGLLRAGTRLSVAGELRGEPESLLGLGYTPKHRISLFDTTFYLAPPRQIPALRFFVAYVVQEKRAWARIFYKDLSLVWRTASHFISTDDEFWIGKGAIRTRSVGGEEIVESDESTTDLPLEIQDALETLNHAAAHIRQDVDALHRVLRLAPAHRIEPYRDFVAPRERAAAHPANRIHRGRSVCRFRRKGDPRSLFVAEGFAPDYRDGVLEVTGLRSTLYGGRVRRFRLLSENRQIQYMFFAGRRHVWLAPPQALTTELSSYGVRTVDVIADDDLFVPGYEYHATDDEDDPAMCFSQIPDGFAGASNPSNPDAADASAWLDPIPMIREFRREVLGR